MKRMKKVIVAVVLGVMMLATSITAYAYLGQRPCGHAVGYHMIGTSLGMCPHGCQSSSFLAECNTCHSRFGVCQSGHEQ